ncbi:nuclear transport factor 2 family protein [Spirosoma areae]
MDEKSIQPLVDEMAIRSLADKFSDAANRKDGAMFQSLWATDGAWLIGEPINRQFSGKISMGESLVHMLGLWDFFVQLTGPGVVLVEGERAYARFYVNEIARGKDGTGNYNLSMYEDELIKEDGQWLFHKRTYHTIYQDAPDYRGVVLGVPEIPAHIRAKSLNR